MSNSQHTMRHIEISEPGKPNVLKITQTSMPVPKSHEVLIRIKAAGINRPDILQRQGLYPMPKGVTPIPGLEVAGVVAAVGDDVNDFRVGDRVCGLTNGGGYAEYCVVPESQTLPTPDHLSDVEAAAIPETYFTVWANLFDIGQLKKDQTVLIHGGASGIGTTALSLCHAMGIKTFSTVGSDDKVQQLSNITTAINYKKDDFEQVIMQKTNQQGVDIVLDIVGAKYFKKNMNLLKRDGRLVVVGFMGGTHVNDLDLQQLIVNRITITGSTMRGRNSQEKQAIAESLKQHVWPLFEQNKLHPIVYKTFDFDDVVRAHEEMEQSNHIGKIVLKLAD